MKAPLILYLKIDDISHDEKIFPFLNLIVVKKASEKVSVGVVTHTLSVSLVDFAASTAALKKYVEAEELEGEARITAAAERRKWLTESHEKLLKPLVMLWIDQADASAMYPSAFWVYNIITLRKIVFLSSFISSYIRGEIVVPGVLYNIHSFLIKLEQGQKYWLNYKILQKSLCKDPVNADLFLMFGSEPKKRLDSTEHTAPKV